MILDTYFQRLTNTKRPTEKQGTMKLRIKSTKYCRHQHFPIYSRAHKKVFEYGITSGLTGVIIPLRNKADYLLFLGRTISYSNQITVSNFLNNTLIIIMTITATTAATITIIRVMMTMMMTMTMTMIII